MLTASREQPSDGFYTVPFKELASDNAGTIEKVYRHFGWDISTVFRARLNAASEQGKKFKSVHRYTLEEFGLSEEWIQTECREVIDGYGLQDA